MTSPPNLYRIEKQQSDGSWTQVPETGAFSEPELAKKSLSRISALEHSPTLFRVSPIPFSFNEIRDYEFSAQRLQVLLIANDCPIETVTYRKEGHFEVTFSGSWSGVIFPEWESRPVWWTMKPETTHSLIDPDNIAEDLSAEAADHLWDIPPIDNEFIVRWIARITGTAYADCAACLRTWSEPASQLDGGSVLACPRCGGAGHLVLPKDASCYPRTRSDKCGGPAVNGG